MDFEDHFSGQAKNYQQYRPGYPGKLFQYLVSLLTRRDRAWDCGTGNGQVAITLSAYFNEVIATDASREQLEQAPSAENVHYRVARAESAGLSSDSIDLITVGQALHWFDLEAFYNEAKRVLREEGVLAAWTYQLCHINDELNRLIQTYYHQVVGSYWPEERKLVEEGYESLSFPFHEIDAPDFVIEEDWNLHQFLGYLRTWSAAKNFRRQMGADPVEPLENYFKNEWGDPEQLRRVYWPVRMRVGRYLPSEEA